MTGPLTPRQAGWRYLVLLFLRWFPVGLVLPILVLLPLDRGLTLAQYGAVAALQGLVVLVLELPTGGLSDAWGRRPVLLVAGGFAVVSIGLMAVADSVALFAVVYLLQGVYRALESGPLEAWYVDTVLAHDPLARLERGLSAGGTVLGVGVAAGALATSGLVAWVRVPGVTPLTLPVLVALTIQVIGLIAIAVLVREPVPSGGRRTLLTSVRGVPSVIAQGARLVRRSRVLALLLAVELCWGFGMVTFESLMPARLEQLVGGTERAAQLTGPAGSAAWLVGAAGAALVPLLTARLRVAWTAVALRILQGGAVLAMGLLAGPAGLLTGYLAAYLVHGAANPVHMTLLHHEVGSANRSTVVSMNSMVAQPAGALGLVVLTWLSGVGGVSTAIVVGAAVLAAAAPLYLPAVQAERARRGSHDAATAERDVGSAGARSRSRATTAEPSAHQS